MSRPLSFNDPFDCIGAIRGRPTANAIKGFVRDAYREKDVDFYSEEAFRHAFDLLEPRHTYDAVYGREYVNSLCIILCLVDAKDLSSDSDTLLWSHYGECGKGVRITFDIPAEGGAYILEKVAYKSEIPSYDLAKADAYFKGDDFVHVYRRWICTKGTAWQYEHEVRLILHEPDMEQHRIVANGLEYFAMPRNWIKEVAFGSESDVAVAHYYAALLCNAGFRLVFRYAKKSQQEYGYGYVDL